MKRVCFNKCSSFKCEVCRIICRRFCGPGDDMGFVEHYGGLIQTICKTFRIGLFCRYLSFFLRFFSPSLQTYTVVHFLSRAICLIILPVVLYIIFFYVHLCLLNKR